MHPNNSEAGAAPNSSDISDSLTKTDFKSSNKLDGDTTATPSSSASSTSSSSSGESIDHDEGISKQAPPIAGISAASTVPGIAQNSTSEPKATALSAKPKKDSRPRFSSRRSSGSIIIPRDSEIVEDDAEVYDEGDARAMSPPRSTEEVDKMTEEARATLTEQAKTLQSNIGDLVDRVETVKTEHDKLETGNKFLQSYIGQLMHSTKITATGAGRSSKGKNRVS